MAQNYYSGIEAGKKIYLDGLQKYGFNESSHREKIVKTCRNYAFNKSIKKTKKGVLLTKDKRLFYKGMSDFLIAPNRLID